MVSRLHLVPPVPATTSTLSGQAPAWLVPFSGLVARSVLVMVVESCTIAPGTTASFSRTTGNLPVCADGAGAPLGVVATPALGRVTGGFLLILSETLGP